MSYTRLRSILTSGSSGTGPAIFVGDARLLTVSIQSSTGSASRFTFDASNDDGFKAAIGDATWSTLTVLTAKGIYTVDPGARWIRAQQPVFSLSATSANTVMLERYFQC